MPARGSHLWDRVLLLLINGRTIEATEGYCVQQGLDQDPAKGVVQNARKRLTVAADYARDEQLGRAVMRLDEATLEASLEEARKHQEVIPDYALDCHTSAGKRAGRTKQMSFREEFDALTIPSASLRSARVWSR